MSHHHSRAALAAALLGCTVMACPLFAQAQCCPSDGNTAPKSAQGLGQTNPPAVDLAVDPTWQVYEFERGGVRYVQINDRNGTVRAAVGVIGDMLWALPVGVDADRVVTPGEPMPATATGSGVVIYRGSDVEVRKYQGSDGDTWSIAPAR